MTKINKEERKEVISDFCAYLKEVQVVTEEISGIPNPNKEAFVYWLNHQEKRYIAYKEKLEKEL